MISTVRSVLLVLLAATAPVSRSAEGMRVGTSNTGVIDGVIRADNLDAVQDALLKAAPGSTFDLVINSPGGSVTTGFAFVSAMESAKQKGVAIRCFVPTVAASMAFQILLHCNERHVLDRSFLLWHRARVMMGGFFGGPMTAPQLLTLGRDLERLDEVILTEVLEYVNMSGEDIRYHFEAETLHVGSVLCDLAKGSFTSHSAIPGLFEALQNMQLPRTIVERDPFGRILEGNPFRFGEIIYIRPGSISLTN